MNICCVYITIESSNKQHVQVLLVSLWCDVDVVVAESECDIRPAAKFQYI